ncbi:uncharacterized protein [Clytia hemisphaerica]|uniref:Uncharacterized protein n=1 Tax=Clytia hemisphaerica TaxID=252671 RepID=A0A7M5TVY2_9CNID|eukprot:TCONS_00013044-protein
MTLSFNITSGTSETTPKKHFIPRPLRRRSRAQSIKDEEQGIPVYKPVLEIGKSLHKEFPFNSRIIDDGTLVWFSLSGKQEITLNSIHYKNNRLQVGQSWSINESINKKKGNEKCLNSMVTFSPDLSFGVLLQHTKSRVTFQSPKTYIRVSILKFQHSGLVSSVKNPKISNFDVYKNVLVMKGRNGDIFKKIVLCLSPRKNLLALVLRYDFTHSTVFVFQINYNKTADQYSLDSLLQKNVDYEINSIKFNEFENTLLLLGSRSFHVLYPIDGSTPSESRIYGVDPYIIYDNKLKCEFIFAQSKDNFYEVDIYQVKQALKRASVPQRRFFDYKKLRNIEYDRLKQENGIKRVFYVHHFQNITRLFLGFTKKVYIFNPFSCQLLYKLDLSCSLETPYCYTLDANWSGKEVSLFCWDNFNFVSLKIYHLEEEFDMSLKQQALLAVQANYSLETLKKMRVPKFILASLGDTSV